MSLPKNLRYTKNAWVRIDADKAAIGVTDSALKATKEIVFIELPKVGQDVKKGQELLVLESIKWSGRISSPLSGEVTKVNDSLFDDPSELNKDPYGAWVCEMKLSQPNEVDSLMDAASAEEQASDNR